MRLLLDENLSRRLSPFLLHSYPGTSHVCLLGLESAFDVQVWDTAKREGFVIVTRDADFQELSLVWGQPPKVEWKDGCNLPFLREQVIVVLDPRHAFGGVDAELKSSTDTDNTSTLPGVTHLALHAA